MRLYSKINFLIAVTGTSNSSLSLTDSFVYILSQARFVHLANSFHFLLSFFPILMHESISYYFDLAQFNTLRTSYKESEAKGTPQTFESKLSSYTRNLLYSIF